MDKRSAFMHCSLTMAMHEVSRPAWRWTAPLGVRTPNLRSSGGCSVHQIRGMRIEDCFEVRSQLYW